MCGEAVAQIGQSFLLYNVCICVRELPVANVDWILQMFAVTCNIFLLLYATTQRTDSPTMKFTAAMTRDATRCHVMVFKLAISFSLRLACCFSHAESLPIRSDTTHPLLVADYKEELKLSVFPHHRDYFRVICANESLRVANLDDVPR